MTAYVFNSMMNSLNLFKINSPNCKISWNEFVQYHSELLWVNMPSRPPLFPTITYLTPLTYNMHSSKLAERLTWTMGTSIKLWEGLQSSCPGATGKETGMTAPIIRYSVLSLPYWLLHCLLNTASRDVQFTTS